ncbi:hypothetical protein EON65_36755 [archaeon]|nr:MAG: hypothetical protein EON65_36755 [archaeon]
MIVFLSTLLFLLPVFASSAVYWIGGSGLWSDGTKWSNQQQPASSSEVYINSSSYSVVTIDGDVTVSKLVIEDGVIDIGIGSLTVQNAFTFYKGTLTRQQAKLYNPITSIPSAGLVSVLGNSSFLSGNRKRMEFISFVQKPNTTLEWFNGDLILTNSTITIEKNARFVVTSKTSNLTLASDQAQRYFNYYPYRLLNTALNLVTMYPPNEGVYDIISPDVVRVSTTSTYGQTLYPLAVKDDPEAIAYFAYHVTNSNFGYRLPLYNRTIVDVDPDQCAWICTTAYQQWCASFEYLTYNRTCKLGAFNLIKAGGLSYEVQTAQGVEYPVYHYERRILEERPVDSFLIVEGSMVTSCDDPLTSCNLFLTVRTTVTGALSILDHSSVLFTDQVVLESSSISSLTPTSSLAAVGINSSLIMEYGADLTSSSMSPISFPVLTLQDGHHFVSGNISPDFSFIIMGTAQVDIQCTASPTGNISQSVFSHLAVQDNGVLAFVSSSSTVNVSGNVNLTDSAVMTGYSLNISISGVLFVSASASLSVAFNGYNSDGGGYKGLGAGADYSLGASGGSYGGKGGPGKVDTLGGAYGSAVHPWHLGMC